MIIDYRSSFFLILFALMKISRTSAWPYVRRRDIFDNAVDGPEGAISHLKNMEDILYGLPNNDTGSKVAEWTEEMTVNPEELGPYAEGDILFPTGIGRNGLKSETTRWPGGVVPYMISPYFSKYFILFFRFYSK